MCTHCFLFRNNIQFWFHQHEQCKRLDQNYVMPMGIVYVFSSHWKLLKKTVYMHKKSHSTDATVSGFLKNWYRVSQLGVYHSSVKCISRLLMCVSVELWFMLGISVDVSVFFRYMVSHMPLRSCCTHFSSFAQAYVLFHVGWFARNNILKQQFLKKTFVQFATFGDVTDLNPHPGTAWLNNIVVQARCSWLIISSTSFEISTTSATRPVRLLFAWSLCLHL